MGENSKARRLGSRNQVNRAHGSLQRCWGVERNIRVISKKAIDVITPRTKGHDRGGADWVKGRVPGQHRCRGRDQASIVKRASSVTIAPSRRDQQRVPYDVPHRGLLSVPGGRQCQHSTCTVARRKVSSPASPGDETKLIAAYGTSRRTRAAICAIPGPIAMPVVGMSWTSRR
jgi:hypothetical protein